LTWWHVDVQYFKCIHVDICPDVHLFHLRLVLSSGGGCRRPRTDSNKCSRRWCRCWRWRNIPRRTVRSAGMTAQHDTEFSETRYSVGMSSLKIFFCSHLCSITSRAFLVSQSEYSPTAFYNLTKSNTLIT
jgi:hypothetical protein